MSEPTSTGKENNRGLRIRMAALVTGINAVLTCVKFLLYHLSGSMAILAEAWHSFADIGTSFLVFIAIITEKSHRDHHGRDDGSRPARRYTELCISLSIGLMLTGISCFLIYKFFAYEYRPIENSLISGFIFLLFSFISYAVYRFETRLGETVDSIGLISDGMHSRADMAASLMTGFALILYTMGLNLDRWVSLLIALFVLSFGIETIMNVVAEYFRKDSSAIRRYSFLQALFILFDRQAFHQKMKQVQRLIEKKILFPNLLKMAFKALLALVLLAVMTAVSCSMVFTVAPHERAVVERFGKPVRHRDPLTSGLHVKWPWPVDRLVKIDTLRIKNITIGKDADSKSSALLWTQNHGSEEPFLTGDNNFFYPYIILDYRIKDVFQYLYKNSDPEKKLSEAAHRTATRIFSCQKFYDIASANRSKIAGDIMQTLQVFLDRLETGIEIVNVNLRDIHPPVSVADAFERVIAGYQEKQKIINDALGYRYSVIPKSRGTAAETLEAAAGYMVERVKTAEGKSNRFITSAPNSKKDMRLAMSRIHFDTIRSALKSRKKIVLDPAIGTTNIWMTYEEIPGTGNKIDNRKE